MSPLKRIQINLIHQKLVKDSISKEDLTGLIAGRRSLYPMQYTGERIDDESIKFLLELANTAPSHKLTRPWRFHVFSDESKNALLQNMKEFYIANTPAENRSEKKLKSYQMKMEKTSHIIGIVMKRDEAKRVPEIEEVAAVSCAVQNIYLSLQPMDLAGYWSTGKYAFSEEAKTYLGLNEGESCLGFFYLGKVSLEIPAPIRDSVDERIIWKK